MADRVTLILPTSVLARESVPCICCGEDVPILSLPFLRMPDLCTAICPRCLRARTPKEANDD